MSLVSADPSVQVRTNKAADLTVKKAGDLAACTVHLFTNNINPSALSIAGDFTEATFTGYAAKVVAGWTATDDQADGSVTTTGTGVLSWVGPGDGTGEAIVGYYVLSAGGGTPLIYAVKFAAAQGLNTPTDILNLVPTFRLP